MQTLPNAKLIVDAAREDARAQVVGRVMGQDVTRGELIDAFDRVKPFGNWKDPINISLVIESDREMAMIREAVIVLTGSVPTIEPEKLFQGKLRYRVKAAGYYATIGA